MSRWLMVVVLLVGNVSYAVTRNSPTCSSTDVQNTINSSSFGDVVQLPTCTNATGTSVNTWTTTVNLNVNGVYVKGNGKTNTIIYDHTVNGAISITNASNSTWPVNTIVSQVSDISFYYDTDVTSPSNRSTAIGIITIQGTNFQVGWYIHDNNFHISACHSGNGTRAIYPYGVYGAAINNTFYYDVASSSCSIQFMTVFGTLSNTDAGTTAWQQAFAPGLTGNGGAVYIENDTFCGSNNGTSVNDGTCSNAGGNKDPEDVIDGNAGARIVTRYSTFNNAHMGTHGTDGFFRSVMSNEFYHNSVVNNTTGYFWTPAIRGGTLISFDNVFSGSHAVQGSRINYYRGTQGLYNFSYYGSLGGYGNCTINWTMEYAVLANGTNLSKALRNTLSDWASRDYQKNHTYSACDVIAPQSNNTANMMFVTLTGGTTGNTEPTFSSSSRGSSCTGTTTWGCTVSDPGAAVAFNWISLNAVANPTTDGGTNDGKWCSVNLDNGCRVDADCAAYSNYSAGETCSAYFDQSGTVGRDGIGRVHNQALFPVIATNNTYSSGLSGAAVWVDGGPPAGVITQNVDYFIDNCNSVVGCVTGVTNGLAGARPGTCTSPSFYGVLDANNHLLQIDKCTATNVWTSAIYTPYTYPHPLTNPIPPFNFTASCAGTSNGTITTGGLEVNAVCTAGVCSGTCTNSFLSGSVITVTSTATSGSFIGSTGTGSAAACSTSPCTFTILVDSTLQSTFSTVPTNTLGCVNGGTICAVNRGAPVTLTSTVANVSGVGSGWYITDPLGSQIITCNYPTTCAGTFNGGSTPSLTFTPILTGTYTIIAFSGGVFSTPAVVTVNINDGIYGTAFH